MNLLIFIIVCSIFPCAIYYLINLPTNAQMFDSEFNTVMITFGFGADVKFFRLKNNVWIEWNDDNTPASKTIANICQKTLENN